MNLFRHGRFTLASGAPSPFKIDCDALTPADWGALAFAAARLVPPFREVRGVPRGGVPFADALRGYADPASGLLLLADDVFTTGGSLNRFLASTEVGPFSGVCGVCVFARGTPFGWVAALFQMPEISFPNVKDAS